MTRVRYPRLLDSSYAEKKRLQPTAESLTFNLRETSTAQMTLAGDEVQMRDWIELFTAKGSAGIFRVTEVDSMPRRETTATLRHAIDTLSDEVWQDQTDFDGTVDEFLAALLAQQTAVRWQLGTCADTSAYKKSGINYTKLSELFWGLAGDRMGYYYTFDFSTSPWTVNFLALPQTPAAEFRLSRNVQTMTIRRTDTEMCNRLYLSVNTKGTPELQTYNNTDSQAIYGLIIKTADIDTEDIADPEAWAADFLARRASPAVQITVDGYELTKASGETFDEMSLGKMCRVALPSVPETLTETIVTVTYPDVMSEPERVMVDLNNHFDKFSETIANLKKAVSKAGGGAGAAGRAAAANAEEIEYWAQVVTHHSDIIDGTDLDELYQSGIIMDAQSGVTIYNLSQGFTSNYAGIQVNAQAISSEVSTARSNESALSSRITQNANSISLVVSNGSIDAASIVAAINGASSSVTISADHIVLDGATVASVLATQSLTVASLSAGNTTINGSLTVPSGYSLSLLGSAMYVQNIKPGTSMNAVASVLTDRASSDIDLEHYHAISVSESNGVVTITQGAVSATAGSDSFNIANTQYYQSGVAAARTAGWASAAGSIVWPTAGTSSSIAITYPDQTYGDTLTTHYGMTQTTWSGKSKYVNLYSDDTSMGAVARVSVDASSVYDNGWDAAAGAIGWPSSGSSSGATFTFPVTGGTTSSKAYVLTQGSWSNGSLTVRMRDGSASGTTVADTTVNMPSSATLSVTVTGPSGASGSWSASCNVGGKTYTNSGSWMGRA